MKYWQRNLLMLLWANEEMNMNEFLSLKILDSFKNIFEKFGIDYKLLRVILKTKLTLDMRRAPAINTNQKRKEEGQTSLLKGYLLHLIFGVFLAFFIYFIKDEMIRMMYFSGAFFFMTTMYLISDFSFVLLDTKDKNILMTKPVDSRIVSLSKILHILIYMFRLNAFIAGPTLIAMVMSNDIFVIPIFLLEILLMDLIIFLVTAFIYLLVLRFFDGELLRNIINAIQILLTILVTVGYQIAIRMIDFTSLQNMEYTFSPTHYLNPILWFGAPFEILYNGWESYLYVFTALIIIVPIVSFVFYLSLSKKMESLLLKLEGEGKERPSKHRFERLVGLIINRNDISKKSFHFSNAMFRSDRSLKLKIYPALSSGLLLPVLMIFNMRMGGREFETTGYEYLYLYFNLLMFPTIYNLTYFSSAWKGSYVFASSGFKNIKELYKGLMKSMAYRFFIPLIILNVVIYSIIFENRFVMDFVIIFLVSIVIMPIIGKIYFKGHPFAQPIDESNQKDSLDKFLLSLAIAAGFAILHFYSHMIPRGTWIYLAVLLAGVPVSWNFIPQKIK
jgi:ABC-2 type transport system permease protein